MAGGRGAGRIVEEQETKSALILKQELIGLAKF